MKICENVYQIKIDFYVTPEIKRYVYVYLITGKNCYLIDAGVAGSETVISRYMEELGRSITEIEAIFLTHVHPDHMGGAAEIKRLSGCEVYASQLEKEWIENIETQARERPIPNFYTLVKESVHVDHLIKEQTGYLLEPGITVKALETPGHSNGSVSYLFEEKKVLFCGDVVPVTDDFPIFVNERLSENSIQKILKLKELQFCCPAWDRAYIGSEINEILHERLELLGRLKECVRQVRSQHGELSEEEMICLIGTKMGWGNMNGNPLFRRSVMACDESGK